MNTAVIAPGAATPRSRARSTVTARMLRRLGLAIVAWGRAAERRRAAPEPAELHELRREAERLREERFREVALTRML
ncbi:hypothetical protein GE115_07040 [Agromyces sp. CFH 90414]|uniref:Uncharacterized protein n=1 Tax=Agromyces agglutinans TaxID=2662258 RepID=A0A6I2FB10_9MICO|nr:hypothetical protein [Agromyces agglutinans]MRG59626.1 hypothetical protein [Agromyces agglutinans]